MPRLMRLTSIRSSTSRTNLRQLPLHHGASLLDGIPVAAAHSHHLQAVADRGQRVAQFVGQRRQELVLATVGVLERPFQSFTVIYVNSDRNPAIG